jgi:folylpolyglutamate synthase/dihydropteroate synthase
MELQQEAQLFNLHGSVYPSSKAALAAATNNANAQNDVILVIGSIFLAAEVLK